MDARFPYAAKAATKVVGIVVGGGMTAFAAWSLATGTAITRRGNALSSDFSTWVWIGLLVVGLALLVWGVRLAVAGTRTVVVTEDVVEAPRTLAARGVVRVPIRALGRMTVANDPLQGQVLHILVEGGKPLHLARNGFADAQAFAACHDAIVHARAAQQR